jgi:hypothetical protein
MNPQPHTPAPWVVRHIHTALDFHRYIEHEKRILRTWQDRGRISKVHSLKVSSPSDIAAALSTPAPPGNLVVCTLQGWADDEGVWIGARGGDKPADYFDLADLPTAGSHSAAILFTGCQGTSPWTRTAFQRIAAAPFALIGHQAKAARNDHTPLRVLDAVLAGPVGPTAAVEAASAALATRPTWRNAPWEALVLQPAAVPGLRRRSS